MIEAQNIAEKILILSRNTLLIHFRFLSVALYRLMLKADPGGYQTDGLHLFYDVKHVLQSYQEDRDRVTRDYFHILLHLIFRHPFVGIGIDPLRWDLAADIAAEVMVSSLSVHSLAADTNYEKKQIIDTLKKSIKIMSAENIYRHLKDHPHSEEELHNMRRLFFVDDHSLWYERSEGTGRTTPSHDSQQSISDIWQDISERIKIDLETASKAQGDKAGNLLQELKELHRERYDYRNFLKNFAVLGEVMKINDDEFDYIFYTYGLSLYDNMPLIEPLEYKDEKRIREFVIAIDTSGSTSGELVQSFLQKTYNILISTESFFSRITLYIIQCDAEIQEVIKISSPEECHAVIQNFEIKGLGGTDFRPVFQYVDQLLDEKAFSNLNGLIYFTDGYGTFPEMKPPYPTAFVFFDNHQYQDNNLNVPPWAIRLILRQENILEEAQP